MLDLVRDTVIVRDLQGRLVLWNNAAEDLCGWRRAHAIGQSLHVLLPPDAPTPIADVEKRLLEAGQWDGEVVRTTATGVKVVVETRWVVRRDGAGAAIDIIE